MQITHAKIAEIPMTRFSCPTRTNVTNTSSATRLDREVMNWDVLVKSSTQTIKTRINLAQAMFPSAHRVLRSETNLH